MRINISDVCTIDEFAVLLKVHPNTVRNGIKSGKIHAFRVNKGIHSSWRILKTEIMRMCEDEFLEKKSNSKYRKIINLEK